MQLYIEMYCDEEKKFKKFKNEILNWLSVLRPPSFLVFQGTQSGVGHPEMHPSCRELNSDDFPFFRNLSSTSGTRESFFHEFE